MRDWLSNPVTLAHKAKLAELAKDRCNILGLDTNKQSLDAIGLESMARKFEAGGILQAYDHDADMFHGWLVGGE